MFTHILKHIQIFNLAPSPSCTSMLQKLNFSYVWLRHQVYATNGNICVLTGDCIVPHSSCFCTAHCFICILTGTINHVAWIHCWGASLSSASCVTLTEHTHFTCHDRWRRRRTKHFSSRPCQVQFWVCSEKKKVLSSLSICFEVSIKVLPLCGTAPSSKKYEWKRVIRVVLIIDIFVTVIEILKKSWWIQLFQLIK